MTTRDDVVAYARSLDGLSAAPSAPERRAAYLALIAPGEAVARAAAMAQMSGCALVQRGVLRRFIRHPILDAPYRDRRAMSDLTDIAREAGALHGWVGAGASRDPEPGDFVIVGGGDDGGGPEHVYAIIDITPDPYTDGALLVTALDGGQRDDDGHQFALVRDHVIKGLTDRAMSANDRGGGLQRRVRWVLDMGAILARFAQ